MVELNCSCGLGIIVPEPEQQEINRWREKYDPSYPALPPHLTLAYPPFLPPRIWPQVRPKIETTVRQFRPFKIHLSEVGIFPGSQSVLWLKPVDDGTLLKIRQSLEDALPVYVPELPFEYVPHITIGFFSKQEALDAAAQTVRNSLRPLSFEVDELTYLVQDEDGDWYQHDTISLTPKPETEK